MVQMNDFGCRNDISKRIREGGIDQEISEEVFGRGVENVKKVIEEEILTIESVTKAPVICAVDVALHAFVILLKQLLNGISVCTVINKLLLSATP